MTRQVSIAVLATVLTIGASGASASGDGQGNGRGERRFSARLVGENEVPVVSTPARGKFDAELQDGVLSYEMTFEGLQANITQAHIHIAQPDVNGVIVLWLCGTAANPGPAGTQVCPQDGTISGNLSAANVVGPSPLPANGPPQGISAGDFEKVIEQIRNGNAYVNIHTTQSGGGEIRGQIQNGRGGH